MNDLPRNSVKSTQLFSTQLYIWYSVFTSIAKKFREIDELGNNNSVEKHEIQSHQKIFREIVFAQCGNYENLLSHSFLAQIS